MADYGPSESVSLEGVAVLMIFVGAAVIAGSVAYGDGAMQIIGTAVGIAIFLGAWVLGWMIKPATKMGKTS